MNDKNQRIIIRQKTIALKKKNMCYRRTCKNWVILVMMCITFLKTGHESIPWSPLSQWEKRVCEKTIAVFSRCPIWAQRWTRNRCELPTQMPLAFTQVRVRGTRKPHQSWLTKQPKEELKRLTRAASALWLNIGSTEPSQRGDYYGARTAATLPHT